MSQSPQGEADSNQLFEYRKAWAALNTLLEQGRSLSGHERHCAFLNTGETRFADISDVSGLNLLDDGRGVARVDWNHDGQVDFWTSNRTAPWVRLLVNRSTVGHHFVGLKLRGVTCNRDAIGARLELQLGGTERRILYRTVRAGEGFVSQSSKWVTIGLGDETKIDRLTVRWPGGEEETFTGLAADQHFHVIQGESVARRVQRGQMALATRQVAPTKARPQHVTFATRVPLPNAAYDSFDGTKKRIFTNNGRPTAVVLWASWCAPCIAELKSWGERANELRGKINVVTVAVDGATTDGKGDVQAARRLTEKVKLPFPTGVATSELLSVVDGAHALVDKPSPLAVPSMLLFDSKNRLVKLYRGAVEVDELLRDMDSMGDSDHAWRDAAAHFPGRWFGSPPAGETSTLVRHLVASQDLDLAGAYVRELVAKQTTQRDSHTEACYVVADAHRAAGEQEQAISLYELALQSNPTQPRINLDLAKLLLKRGEPTRAIQCLRIVLTGPERDQNTQKLMIVALTQVEDFKQLEIECQRLLDDNPTDAIGRSHLAYAFSKQGKFVQARRQLEQAVANQPTALVPKNALAWLLATSPDETTRDGERAIALASSICKATSHSQPALLDTLAAAQAEAGEFDDAINTLNQALEMLPSGNKLREELYDRRALYRSRMPYRQPNVTVPE